MVGWSGGGRSTIPLVDYVRNTLKDQTCEGRLPAARNAGDHDQLIARNLKRDIVEIVLFGTDDVDVIQFGVNALFSDVLFHRCKSKKHRQE